MADMKVENGALKTKILKVPWTQKLNTKTSKILSVAFWTQL